MKEGGNGAGMQIHGVDDGLMVQLKFQLQLCGMCVVRGGGPGSFGSLQGVCKRSRGVQGGVSVEGVGGIERCVPIGVAYIDNME